MATTAVRSALACAVLVMTVVAISTTRDVLAQRPSPAEGPWSGQAQCVVVSKGTDYLDEQTHTWWLTGEPATPAPRGMAQVYFTWPATWSVQGNGRKTWPSREPGGREQSEGWTSAHEMKMALRITEVGAGTGRLRIGTEGQRGAPLGSLRVTEVSGRTRDASVQQWAFPSIEDSAANTTISGTNTRTYPEGWGVGWGQPPKAITTATCTWSFTRGGVEQSSANQPVQTSGRAGRDITAVGPAQPPPAGGRGLTGAASASGTTVPSISAPASPTAIGTGVAAATAPRPGRAGSTASDPQPDDAAAVDGTALTGGAPGAKLLCAPLPPPPFSATPGSVTFTLNRPAGTTGYLISRRDLGDLTPAPVTDSSFTHVAPLGYWTTYEHMFHGVLADGGCTTAIANVTPPRPLTPQVTANVTLGSTQSSRVTLSWGAQSDRPTSYLILGAGLTEAGGEVPASTGSAPHSFEIVNLTPGTHGWEVFPLWKTPTGNMSDVSGALVTATVLSTTVGPSMARTIDLPGFTGSGGWLSVGPRTIELTGFTGTGTTYVGPRTITLDGWTANGPFAPIQGVVK